MLLVLGVIGWVTASIAVLAVYMYKYVKRNNEFHASLLASLSNRDNVFPFEFDLNDIVHFDNKTVQEIIKTHRKELPTAFRCLSDELKKKLLDNMSTNMRKDFQDDCSMLSQVSIDDVDKVITNLKWTAWALSPLRKEYVDESGQV